MSRIYSLDDLKQTVPAAFSTKASPKMSNKYVFVPTIDIVDKFNQEGWNVYSAKQVGGGQYGVHELRLRNSELPQVGDSLIEAIIRNSHNGLSTFNVSAGLHRLVCSNGLTVPTSVSDAFSIRHQSFDLGEVKRLTDDFAQRLPVIQNSVNKMKSRELTEGEQVGFVKSATAIRWKEGKAPSTIKIEDILQPLRDGDKGNDMWTTFNVVQEKFVRGGVQYMAGKRSTSMRELSNIYTRNKVNTQLWELAESYC